MGQDLFLAGAIGGTFIGNPVALAAALAVLDIFEEEELVARAVTIGNVVRTRMREWQSRWPPIGDVRGLGAMLAIELVRDRHDKTPAPELADATESRTRASPGTGVRTCR